MTVNPTAHSTVNPGERHPAPSKATVVTQAVKVSANRNAGFIGVLILALAGTAVPLGLPLLAAPLGVFAGILIAKAK